MVCKAGARFCSWQTAKCTELNSDCRDIEHHSDFVTNRIKSSVIVLLGFAAQRLPKRYKSQVEAGGKKAE